jgi:hypothetical protein
MTIVKNFQFGLGKVISEENGKATINFNGSIKTLIVKFAHLTNEDGSEFIGSTEFKAVAAKANPYHKNVTAEQKQAKLSAKLAVTAHHEPLTQKEKEDLEDYMKAQQRNSISW